MERAEIMSHILERNGPMSDLCDDDITKLLVNRDREAFDEFYRRNFLSVFGYISWALSGDGFFQPYATEDLTQEVFLRSYKKIDQFRFDMGPIKPWLFRIATNIIIDYVRLRTRKPECGLVDNVPGSNLNNELDKTPEEITVGNTYDVEIVDLRIAQEMLPDKHRDPIILLLEGYSHKEISPIFDISSVASRKRRERAITALKEIMVRNIVAV